MSYTNDLIIQSLIKQYLLTSITSVALPKTPSWQHRQAPQKLFQLIMIKSLDLGKTHDTIGLRSSRPCPCGFAPKISAALGQRSGMIGRGNNPSRWFERPERQPSAFLYGPTIGGDMLARKVWLPKQIGVRLDDRLIALVQQRADDERMSVSRYVRTLIEREVTRDLLKDQHDGQG
jgi:hypothetical protein